MSETPRDDDTLLTDDIRELLRLLAQSDITELSLERGSSKLHIKRGIAQQASQPPAAQGAAPAAPVAALPAAPAAAPGAQPLEMPAGYTITAPMVGTFYSAASPKDPPFVQEGDEVHAGDVVGIIEAMKMMNEVDSEVSGRVARMLVKNGQPVEYGQPLMVIQPL